MSVHMAVFLLTMLYSTYSARNLAPSILYGLFLVSTPVADDWVYVFSFVLYAVGCLYAQARQ